MAGLFRELNEEHGLSRPRFPFDYVYSHDKPSIVTGQVTRVRCLHVSSEAIVGPYQCSRTPLPGLTGSRRKKLRLTPLTPADEANCEKLIALIR